MKKNKKVKHEKITPHRDKADVIFSLYVRLFHADSNGYCTCITCGKKLLWKGFGQLHAGHYIGRMHINTRYDERNVFLNVCLAICFTRAKEELILYFL